MVAISVSQQVSIVQESTQAKKAICSQGFAQLSRWFRQGTAALYKIVCCPQLLYARSNGPQQGKDRFREKEREEREMGDGLKGLRDEGARR